MSSFSYKGSLTITMSRYEAFGSPNNKELDQSQDIVTGNAHVSS